MKPPSITAVSSAAATSSPKPLTLEKVARAICESAVPGAAPEFRAAFVERHWRNHLNGARAALQSLRQVDDETVEAVATDHGWRGLNRTRDTANLAGRGFKSIVQAILTEGGEG